ETADVAEHLHEGVLAGVERVLAPQTHLAAEGGDPRLVETPPSAHGVGLPRRAAHAERARLGRVAGLRVDPRRAREQWRFGEVHAHRPPQNGLKFPRLSTAMMLMKFAALAALKSTERVVTLSSTIVPGPSDPRPTGVDVRCTW